MPRGHSEQIAVDEDRPAAVRLGGSNIKSRRDKLTPEQPDALQELGVNWV